MDNIAIFFVLQPQFQFGNGAGFWTDDLFQPFYLGHQAKIRACAHFGRYNHFGNVGRAQEINQLVTQHDSVRFRPEMMMIFRKLMFGVHVGMDDRPTGCQTVRNKTLNLNRSLEHGVTLFPFGQHHLKAIIVILW